MKKILSKRQNKDHLIIMVCGSTETTVCSMASDIQKMITKENRLRERDGKERVSFEIVLG